MAKSAFEEYPRETAVRLILLMAGAGILLVVAGFIGRITTFWVAGSILILFAVGSWPKQADLKNPPDDQPCLAQAQLAPPSCQTDDDLDGDSALLESVRAQFRLLRERLARERKEKADLT